MAEPGDPTYDDYLKDNAERSAHALLNKTLSDYGLPASLGDTLWTDWHIGQKKSVDQILLDMPQTKEYKARFPGMDEQRKKGTGMTEAGYIQYENTVKGTMKQYGIPDGFYDKPEDIANFMNRGVSVNEVVDRVKMAASAAMQSPVETRDELHRMYGMDLGHLTTYFLDPDNAQPLLEKELAAANIGGASKRTGFGMLSQAEAERMADLNADKGNLDQGFDKLVQQQELFGAQDAGEQDIDRASQLGSQFGGDAAAQEAVRRRIAGRVAKFQSGGSYAAGNQGVSGLGTADR